MISNESKADLAVVSSMIAAAAVITEDGDRMTAEGKRREREMNWMVYVGGQRGEISEIPSIGFGGACSDPCFSLCQDIETERHTCHMP